MHERYRQTTDRRTGDGVHVREKPVTDMICNVFGETLNLTKVRLKFLIEIFTEPSFYCEF